jgi:hypothetical protein
MPRKRNLKRENELRRASYVPRTPAKVKLGNRKRDPRGAKPLYGDTPMEYVLRAPMPPVLEAQLKYASVRAGRGRAQLTREALERYLPEILLQPATTKPKRRLESDVSERRKDDVPVQPR